MQLTRGALALPLVLAGALATSACGKPQFALDVTIELEGGAAVPDRVDLVIRNRASSGTELSAETRTFPGADLFADPGRSNRVLLVPLDDAASVDLEGTAVDSGGAAVATGVISVGRASPPGVVPVRLLLAATVPAVPPCGDGKIDAGEECDGADLGGVDCLAFSCTGGDLACAADCRLDRTACTGCLRWCGDGACEDKETPCDCPQDCGAAINDGLCNCLEECGPSVADCSPCCGDLRCDPGDETDCPSDCVPTCGDVTCDAGAGESVCTCPGDCGSPSGDGVCNCGEGCGPAYPDCTACPPTCGDGACDPSETACTCPGDCPQACGDGCCTTPEVACAAPPAAFVSCPSDDCGVYCGDGCCNDCTNPGAGGVENPCTCPGDCPIETASACPGDECCTAAEGCGTGGGGDCAGCDCNGTCTVGEVAPRCAADDCGL